MTGYTTAISGHIYDSRTLVMVYDCRTLDIIIWQLSVNGCRFDINFDTADYFDIFIFQEGTIGHDLVIKPLPLHIRKYLTKKKLQNFQAGDLEGSSSDGDEMFLDREVTLGQDQISKNGFPLDSENEGTLSHPHHVVYRRQSSDNSDLRFSDFGKIIIL